MKQCNVCKKIKSFDKFDKHSRCIGGVTAKCKICRRKYQLKNRDRDNAQRRKHYPSVRRAKQIVNIRSYRKCFQKRSSYHKQWMKKNRPKWRGYYNAKTKEHRMRKLNQMPKCITENDKAIMIQFYKDCPKGFSVDHIIPLKAEHVRGLHVPWNLQYLPKRLNSSKCNRLEYIPKSDLQSFK